MNNIFKNFSTGICNIYQGVCDILTFGATCELSCEKNEQCRQTNMRTAQKKAKTIFNDVNSRFKNRSLQQRHNKILRDLQMTENDFRNLFGVKSYTLGSVNLNGQPGIKINNRPAVINWHTHTVRIRQRD